MEGDNEVGSSWRGILLPLRRFVPVIVESVGRGGGELELEVD